MAHPAGEVAIGRADAAQGLVEPPERVAHPIPGVGHPLYPDGDPRGRLLIELILNAAPASAASAWARALNQAGSEVVGGFPTVDVGLVLLRGALHLPRGSAFLLFAIGRSAGWIAHAMEQYASPQIIRPRAQYSGPAAPILTS